MHELLTREESGLKYLCFMNFSRFLWVKAELGENKLLVWTLGKKQYYKEFQTLQSVVWSVSWALSKVIWNVTCPSSQSSIINPFWDNVSLAPLPITKQRKRTWMCCKNPLPSALSNKRHSTTCSLSFFEDMSDHNLFCFSHVQKLILKNRHWTRGEGRGGQSLSLPLVSLSWKLLSFTAYKKFITLFEE